MSGIGKLSRCRPLEVVSELRGKDDDLSNYYLVSRDLYTSSNPHRTDLKHAFLLASLALSQPSLARMSPARKTRYRTLQTRGSNRTPGDEVLTRAARFSTTYKQIFLLWLP